MPEAALLRPLYRYPHPTALGRAIARGLRRS
jgi:hypothetical protein